MRGQCMRVVVVGMKRRLSVEAPMTWLCMSGKVGPAQPVGQADKISLPSVNHNAYRTVTSGT